VVETFVAWIPSNTEETWGEDEKPKATHRQWWKEMIETKKKPFVVCTDRWVGGLNILASGFMVNSRLNSRSLNWCRECVKKTKRVREKSSQKLHANTKSALILHARVHLARSRSSFKHIKPINKHSATFLTILGFTDLFKRDLCAGALSVATTQIWESRLNCTANFSIPNYQNVKQERPKHLFLSDVLICASLAASYLVLVSPEVLTFWWRNLRSMSQPVGWSPTSSNSLPCMSCFWSDPIFENLLWLFVFRRVCTSTKFSVKACHMPLVRGGPHSKDQEKQIFIIWFWLIIK